MFTNLKENKLFKYWLINTIVTCILVPFMIDCIIQTLYWSQDYFIILGPYYSFYIFSGVWFICELVFLIITIKKRKKENKNSNDWLFSFLFFLILFLFSLAIILLLSYALFSVSIEGDFNELHYEWIPFLVPAIVLSSIAIFISIFIFIVNPINIRVINRLIKEKNEENNRRENLILPEYKDLYSVARKIKRSSFLFFFLWILIIPLIFYAFIGLINNIKILTIDWKDKELNEKKVVWFVLSLLLLQFIGLFIFSRKVMKKYEELSNLDKE